MSNSFKVCPTYFSSGAKNFARGSSPAWAPFGYGSENGFKNW